MSNMTSMAPWSSIHMMECYMCRGMAEVGGGGRVIVDQLFSGITALVKSDLWLIYSFEVYVQGSVVPGVKISNPFYPSK